MELSKRSERAFFSEHTDRVFEENRRLVRYVVATWNPSAVRSADPVEEAVSLDDLAGDEETRTTLHQMFG